MFRAAVTSAVDSRDLLNTISIYLYAVFIPVLRLPSGQQVFIFIATRPTGSMITGPTA